MHDYTKVNEKLEDGRRKFISQIFLELSSSSVLEDTNTIAVGIRGSNKYLGMRKRHRCEGPGPFQLTIIDMQLATPFGVSLC